MTTVQIESYADLSQLSAPDIDLKIILRKKVVPDFYEDVGTPAWRRKTATLSLVAGDRTKDLATDFLRMKEIGVLPLVSGLRYIGDDPQLIALAEVPQSPNTPTGYYLVPSTGPPVVATRAIKFDVPAAGTCTVSYTYYSTVPFADLTTSVELDPYIPPHFQWTLVHGLERYLFARRYGQGDPRFKVADEEYGRAIRRASESLEMGANPTPRYVG